MAPKRKRVADDSDTVTELVALLSRSKKKVYSNEVHEKLQTLVDDASSQSKTLFSSSLCRSMYHDELDELLLSTVSPNSESGRLTGEWFLIAFQSVSHVSKARKSKIDKVFERIQDAAAEAIMDPLDDGLEP